MPWVFTQKLVGERYGDQIGQVYRAPVRWFSILPLKAGDRFVYYRPNEAGEGRHYFGVGTIGSIELEPSDPNHRVIRIVDYRPLEPPVPMHLPDGSFAETGDDQMPAFWWSIRLLTDADLHRICDLAAKRASASKQTPQH